MRFINKPLNNYLKRRDFYEKNFITFVDKKVAGKTNIFCYFCLIVAIIGFLLSFLSCYSNEPTQKDYLNLIDKQNVIINDFDKVYDLENTTIYNSKENIIVSIAGNNCEMKAYFNKDKEYVYSENVNTNVSLIGYIFVFVALFFISGMFAYILLLIICIIISKIIK